MKLQFELIAGEKERERERENKNRIHIEFVTIIEETY